MPLFEGIGFSGEKTAVVIDIGAAYTKCGFAGEFGPRCIISSVVKKSGQQQEQEAKIWNYVNADELYSYLEEFFHNIYFRHLLVNPKDRRVVLCESFLCPTVFRETIAKVLFKRFEVPSILFGPCHLLALLGLGSSSGLVLDIGYKETLVLPVYEGIPVIKAWESLPLAGKALHSHLEARLLETCNVTTSQEERRPLSAVMGSLDEKILEDIKVRCCFVTKLERAKAIQMAHFREGVAGETSDLPQPPPDVQYPLNGNMILHISGKIRENTCELLFEQDNEEKSVATLILDAIIKCPIDMRKFMAENLVITGGTAMLPGFKHRLQEELLDLVQHPKYKEELKIVEFKFHPLTGKENYAGWLGGALFGALETLGGRSLSREHYLQINYVPDWVSLAEETDNEKEDKLATRR